MDRRLAAILITDVVGYSRLMEVDESGTLNKLKVLRKRLIHPTIAENNGRIVKLMGDGTLVEFASAVDAVLCAIALQEKTVEHQRGATNGDHIMFRIGVNLDNVIVEDGDIYGDGVNVAARLEGMAEPGGVLIAQSVHDRVADQIGREFFDNGERKFKNISRAIRVWSWPRKLPSLRSEGKPRVFIAEFAGRAAAERQIGADLSDELTAHLARLTGLEVSGDRNKAHYAVEGDVRLATDRTRIFARLIAVDGDRQVWSERYDEDTGDVFDILDRCTPRLAMSVRRRVAADDAALAANRPLDELSLEELLSLAGVRFFTPTKAGWRGGGEIAEEALELAPENFMALAMAAAGLGLADYLYGFRKPEEVVTALAFRRVNQALRINNPSDMLNVTHAALQLFARMRYREAAAAARRSLELNPEYNMGLWMLGAVEVFSGDYDRGAKSATRAVNVDIRDPYVHLYSRVVAYGHLGAGRADEAVEWFRRADQLAPDVAPNLMGLAVASRLDGDDEGARYAVGRLMDAEPEFRLGKAHPLPYKDESEWMRFAEILRSAGVPG